jgi:hypothetical protein
MTQHGRRAQFGDRALHRCVNAVDFDTLLPIGQELERSLEDLA